MQILAITDTAAEKARALMAAATEPAEALRIGIANTGCSGYSYKIDYAVEKGKLDEVIEEKGVRLFIEPKAIMFLFGAVMDYKEDRFTSGFTFENPNAKNVCGCGESFSM